MTSACPNCKSNSQFQFQKQTPANGGYGPMLLPGLGGIFSSAEMNVIVCGECGLIRTFASEKALAQLKESPKWRRV